MPRPPLAATESVHGTSARALRVRVPCSGEPRSMAWCCAVTHRLDTQEDTSMGELSGCQDTPIYYKKRFLALLDPWDATAERGRDTIIHHNLL